MIIGILSIAAWHQTVCADEVVFKNGDKLAGKVKELVKCKMIFESEVAGTVTIDASKIQTFRTDEAVSVHLKDGTEFNQIIFEAGPGLLAVKGDEKLQSREFSIDKVASIDRLIDGKVK
jgi:hypothetical protein